MEGECSYHGTAQGMEDEGSYTWNSSDMEGESSYRGTAQIWKVNTHTVEQLRFGRRKFIYVEQLRYGR